jgi:Tol biopolymer transport system component
MPEALPELERIVTKALAKDREKRYQTIKDMAIDLRRLRHQLEVEAELKRSAQPALSSAGTTVGSSGGQRAAAETATQSAARVTSSVGYFISKVNRHKKGAALVGVLVAIALVGLGDGLYRFFDWNIPAAQPSNSFEKVSLTKLTTSGKTIKAAISPDGNFIAHVLRQDGLQSLWVRQLSTASSLQLVPPAAIYYLGLAFSPDGSYVYYVKAGRSDEALGGLYQVSVLGGAERRLNIEVSGPVAPSPDGKQLAFAYHPDLESELMVANTDGSGQRKLAALDRPSFFGPPAWSPDGEKIVCPVFIMKSAEEGGSFMKVVAFRVKSGTEETLTPQNWVWIDKVAWLPGGGLIMIASDNTSSPLQVWHLSYPGGEVRKITNDLNNYTGVSVSASGDRIVAVQDDLSSNIWIAPRGDAARARQVTSGNYDGYDGLAWTPDGKIVYTSVLNGNHNLWMMEADGTTPKQLTTGAGQDYLPSVSPDGRYIVFVSRRTGTRNVWRMDIDGNDPKRLTDGDTLCPQFLPDSKWVLYASFDSRTATLCKVSIDGGAPVQLTDRDSRAALISKDSRVVSLSPGGKQIAYIVPDRTIEVISFDRFDRMRLIKRFHFPATASKELGWMPDGSAVAFVDTKDGVSNIWIRPLDSRKAIQLTDFKTERIFAFDWSRDGKQLLLSRGTVNNDVVLISETK